MKLMTEKEEENRLKNSLNQNYKESETYGSALSLSFQGSVCLFKAELTYSPSKD